MVGKVITLSLCTIDTLDIKGNRMNAECTFIRIDAFDLQVNTLPQNVALFCSNDYQQSGHGIESPNMEWETRRCEYESQYFHTYNETGICPATCLEHINGLRMPFSVWTRLHRLGGFYRDTTLRIQCWSTVAEEQCCNSVRYICTNTNV